MLEILFVITVDIRTTVRTKKDVVCILQNTAYTEKGNIRGAQSFTGGKPENTGPTPGTQH